MKVVASIIAVLVVCAPALAQELPVPQPLPVEMVADVLADCGVRMPASAFIEAYAKYMEEIETAHAAADAEFNRLEQAAKRSPDADSSKSFSDLDERSLAVSTRLVKELMDRIQIAAPGQEPAVGVAREVLDYFNAYGLVSGGHTSARGKMSYAPTDLTLQAIRYSIRDHGGPEASENSLKICTANLAGRRKALADYTVETRLGRARGTGAPSNSKARMAFAREQLKAYTEAESALKGFLQTAAGRFWLESMIDFRRPMHPAYSLPHPRGTNPARPADYMRVVLRISTLTEEQRKAIRSVALEWINADLAALRAVVDAGGLRGASSMDELRNTQQTLCDNAAQSLSRILGAPELVGPEPSFPDVVLQAELSEADSELLGWPKSDRTAAGTPDKALRSRRYAVRPVEYSEDVVAQIAGDLGLSADQLTVLETAVADARKRWKERVEPHIASAKESELGSTGVTLEQLDASDEVLRGGNANATLAFKEAYACDAELFASLEAALPGTINRDALKVVAVGRRTAEGVSTASYGMEVGASIPADIPRALLVARLTEEGRRKALSEVQPFLPQWEELGRQRQENQRALRVEILLRPNSINANTGEVTRAGRDGTPLSNQDAKDARDVAEEESRRISEAWRAAQTECVERIAAVLSEADAVQWRAAVKRQQWPSAYTDLTALRQQVNSIADAAARAAAKAALNKAELAVIDAGDRAVEVRLRTEEAVRAADRMGSNRINLRSGSIEGMSRTHEIVATEQVRAAIPAEAAHALPVNPALQRLAGS